MLDMLISCKCPNVSCHREATHLAGACGRWCHCGMPNAKGCISAAQPRVNELMKQWLPAAASSGRQSSATQRQAAVSSKRRKATINGSAGRGHLAPKEPGLEIASGVLKGITALQACSLRGSQQLVEQRHTGLLCADEEGVVGPALEFGACQVTLRHRGARLRPARRQLALLAVLLRQRT